MKGCLIICCLLVAGCVSEQQAKEQLSLCPEYMQKNIGPCKVYPISLRGILGLQGEMIKDSEGTFYVYGPFASKDTVLHEAFHSLDWRIATTRNEEWTSFTKDFCSERKAFYGGLSLRLFCVFTWPLQEIPISGYPRLYSTISPAEDAADCFVMWLRNKQRRDEELRRKCQVVGDFAQGKYQRAGDVKIQNEVAKAKEF
jgi:hypothetical protein